METSAAAPQPQRILLVTGLSGAGKSTALQVLEDLGWEAIDNFPVRLLSGLVASDGDSQAPLAIGIDSRTRGFDPARIMALCDELASRGDIAFASLFLDCSEDVVARRYNATRRPHPLARSGPIEDGIRDENALMAPLRGWATSVIDTSEFASNELQQVVRDRFSDTATRAMAITVASFGFSRGAPPLADLLFDMRFLDNPYWVAGLREQTGLDPAVAAHIAADPAFAPSFGRIADLLCELLPHYTAQGRSYLTIAFGCTGGRHRSVYCAEAAAEVLREAGFSPTVVHRNLGTDRAAAAAPAQPAANEEQPGRTS